MSKHIAEQMCRFYAAYYNVNIAIVRPFNVYGPGQKSHFLVPSILRQIRQGVMIKVKDLAPRRDYIYVDDVVSALVRTMNQSDGYYAVNIGSGKSLSVGDVISIAQAIEGTALPVHEEREVRVNEIPDVYADIAEAWKILQWKPRVEFASGIERMLQQEAET
jgi:nucleoside-diphosphate-sugar epimerase